MKVRKTRLSQREELNRLGRVRETLSIGTHLLSDPRGVKVCLVQVLELECTFRRVYV